MVSKASAAGPTWFGFFPPWPAQQSVPPDTMLKGAGGDTEAGCCSHRQPGPHLCRRTQLRLLKYLLPMPVALCQEVYWRILRAAEPQYQGAGAACQPWNSVACEPRIHAKAWERPEPSEVSSLPPQRQQPPLGLAPRVPVQITLVRPYSRRLRPQLPCRHTSFSLGWLPRLPVYFIHR